MVVRVYFDNTTHDWEKTNLVTDKKGNDYYRCKRCGIKGTLEGLVDYLLVKTKRKNPEQCPKAPKAPKCKRKVEIINCRGFSREFEALTPGSLHDTVEPPKGKEGMADVWVMGKTEPVRLLLGEYKEV